MLPNSAPSDRHYQFVCFALYDSQGHLLGNALQILRYHGAGYGMKKTRQHYSQLSLMICEHLLRLLKPLRQGLLQPDITWDEQLLHEILEDIDTEADHLLSLINSFIEMSRIDMGALVLEKEWCDIVEVVHSTFADAKRSVS